MKAALSTAGNMAIAAGKDNNAHIIGNVSMNSAQESCKSNKQGQRGYHLDLNFAGSPSTVTELITRFAVDICIHEENGTTVVVANPYMIRGTGMDLAIDAAREFLQAQTQPLVDTVKQMVSKKIALSSKPQSPLLTPALGFGENALPTN